jgi:hypothetical protein
MDIFLSASENRATLRQANGWGRGEKKLIKMSEKKRIKREKMKRVWGRAGKTREIPRSEEEARNETGIASCREHPTPTPLRAPNSLSFIYDASLGETLEMLQQQHHLFIHPLPPSPTPQHPKVFVGRSLQCGRKEKRRCNWEKVYLNRVSFLSRVPDNISVQCAGNYTGTVSK